MRKHFTILICAAAVAGCGQGAETSDVIASGSGSTIPVAVQPETVTSETAKSIPANPMIQPPQSVEAGISAYVERNFDDAFKVKVTSIRSADVWDFACGDLVPPDKSPARNFCALLTEEPAGFKLLEFEIVGHDAPYYDWFEAHGVPETIIGE